MGVSVCICVRERRIDREGKCVSGKGNRTVCAWVKKRRERERECR